MPPALEGSPLGGHAGPSGGSPRPTPGKAAADAPESGAITSCRTTAQHDPVAKIPSVANSTGMASGFSSPHSEAQEQHQSPLPKFLSSLTYDLDISGGAINIFRELSQKLAIKKSSPRKPQTPLSPGFSTHTPWE